MKNWQWNRAARVMAELAIILLCVLPGRAPAQGGVQGDREAPGGLSNNQADTPSAIFVPVILTAPGRNNSFFTSELTLTNRGSEPAVLNYTYTPHRGGMSYTATDRLGPLQQTIKSDAIAYLRELDVPIPQTGSQVGTLRVDVTGSSEVAAAVRTTTAVPEGRAGLAYPGIPGHEGFQDEAVYLCGLRQNRKDRSNVALQNMGTEGEITLRTTVFSGEAADRGGRRLDDRTLKPGGFYQYNEVLKQLGSPAQGYVKVERVEGEAPFYAYGVINDQANSDGSFVFPVGEDSLAGAMGQTLPVVIEAGPFTSELTVTNFSEEAKAVSFSVAADTIDTADDTATFMVPLAAGQQRIISNVIDTARRQFGLNLPRGLAAPLFARAAGTDMSGIVIGARTGSPADPEDASRGQYSVFYTAVPQGEGFTTSAWVDGLQQNEENRSNLALVNTGAVDDGDIVFTLQIYDGETARLVNTVSNADTTVAARRWHQINAVLRKYGKGATQGFVRITKRSGDNPFLAYGVVNDGGVPGQRSDDGAYLPAVEEGIHDPGTVPVTDRQVLETLYHATGGPDWRNSTNWLSALPLAEWYGVATNQSGRVTSLRLTRNGLFGNIPRELASLTNLKVLYLHANELSGAIPPELAGLTKLESLYLSQNRLTGTIPPELSGLTNLQHLSLYSNPDLTGALPKNLQQLSRLRSLSISRTDVCVPTDAAFEAWLGTLDSFYSSGLVCDGTRRISFSAESYEVKEGDSVTVSVRLIDRTGDMDWSAEIALTAMPGGGATAADYSGVPESITITAPAAEATFVFTAVADDPFDHGETVVLGFRQPLPSGIIEGDPNTARVTIIDPGTEGATDREVLEALYHATGGPEWKNSTNWLSADRTSEWFGVETDGDSRVTSLDLTQNRLIGRIPPALGRLGRLQVLDLHGNQLSGEIPPELGELFDLQVLDLSHNNLSGVIPTELAGLTQLQRLSLSFNKLSGGIPPELGGLTHLQALFLDRNGLSGAIPVALAGLTHLQALDLSHNNLNGVIPTELAGLTQLQRLSLSFNKLSGGILPELGGLTHLQSLFLDRNEISGAIPVALAGLTRLQRLDLQGNKLSGGIPPELGGLTHLQRLSLGSNELSGTIPAELGALTQLQVLSLWTNQLSGAIPVELAGLTRLQSLDLHGNQLTGPIPAELGALTQLHGLSLGSNELSGTIPTELGRLSQLRWLTLQFNPHLSGAIPPGLQQLPLWSLNLMATSVCVPEDAELQERLAKIEWFTSSGLTCGRPPAAMPSIDVAVFHTPAARRVAGGTAQMEAMIDLMIAETNQAYLDSGVNQRLVLVAREEVKYEEETGAFVALARFSNPSDGYMDEVHAIRDRTGADLLHLIADVTNPRGAARLAGEYAITCAKCDSSVFAHELGHNMGLSHDRYVDGGRGRLSYSYGYVNQRAFARDAPESTRWRTIMAYADQCGEAGFGCDWILRFSNPNQTWLGDPLGVTGDERTRAVDGPADAVRTLNLTRHSVAAFRPRASANQLTMSSTLSQARPLAGTGQAAVAALGGSLFRSIAPNERGTPSHRAGGVLDRATLRRREVSVDFRTLARVADGERTALRLNLFDDLVLMGIIERRTSTYSGGYALSGRLAGVPEGTVTLVVNGSVVAGTVRFPGATYRVGSSGAGRHVVLQVDPSQLRQGCEVVTQTPELEQ